MNRKLILSSILIVVIIIVISILVGRSNLNRLRNMEAKDIKEIVISNPATGYTITKEDDIELLLKELQSMNLDRKIINNKDGFAFIIEIKLKNGKKVELSIRSNEVSVDNQTYKSQKNYCDDIRKIFDLLANSYQTN